MKTVVYHINQFEITYFISLDTTMLTQAQYTWGVIGGLVVKPITRGGYAPGTTCWWYSWGYKIRKHGQHDNHVIIYRQPYHRVKHHGCFCWVYPVNHWCCLISYRQSPLFYPLPPIHGWWYSLPHPKNMLVRAIIPISMVDKIKKQLWNHQHPPTSINQYPPVSTYIYIYI